MTLIRPSKHADPDLTVFSVATLILERLKSKRVEKYSELLILVKKRSEDTGSLFLPAINLLYILGLVKYHQKSDCFEYSGLK